MATIDLMLFKTVPDDPSGSADLPLLNSVRSVASTTIPVTSDGPTTLATVAAGETAIRAIADADCWLAGGAAPDATSATARWLVQSGIAFEAAVDAGWQIEVIEKQ